MLPYDGFKIYLDFWILYVILKVLVYKKKIKFLKPFNYFTVLLIYFQLF